MATPIMKRKKGATDSTAGIETRRRRKTPSYPLLTGWRQARFGYPHHEKKEGRNRQHGGNRDPPTAQNAVISIADGVEADSLQHPINAKKKNRAKSAVLLFWWRRRESNPRPKSL